MASIRSTDVTHTTRYAFAAFLAATLAAAACSSSDGESGLSSTEESAAPSADSTSIAVTDPAATTTVDATTTIAPTTTTTEVAPATDAAATTIAPSVYDFAEASAIVDAYVAEQGLNGAGLIVVERDDGVVHEEYWGDFDADRVSLIASSGKMIAAGVLMSLDDQGILDVDAPVADVAEWGASHPTITPAQLLSNSSGLIGLEDGFAFESYHCWFIPDVTLQDCAEQVFTTPDDDVETIEPDTEFRYGGAQWTVAGAVAEAASGRTWAQLVDETISTPCGLESVGFNNRVGFDYPTDFDGDPAVLSPTDNPSPGAGAFSSAPDYAQLMLMQLRGGMCGDVQVLSADAVEAMLADRIGEVYGGDTAGDSTGPDMNGYGLGWWVERDSGRRIAFGGFGATPMLDPDNGFGVYIVTESNGETGRGIALQIYDPIEAAVLAAR